MRRAGEKVPGELGVLQVEQRLESAYFGWVCGRPVTSQPTLEQHVELLHAAPTSPAQPSDLAQACSRSAIMSLISAMALAGLRSLGQASVQFMMVWQR
jgi:hypothetical protein